MDASNPRSAGSAGDNGASDTGHRAAIIGAGSMGTLLAAVLGGVIPVVVVCRETERAAQMFEFGARSGGLIEGSSQPIIVRTIEDLERAGGASVVFVATKTTAIPDVAERLAGCLPRLRGNSRPVYVVSFQNGIDPGRELVRRLGHDFVLRMVLRLGAMLTTDGREVRVGLNDTPHAIGSISSEHEPACRALAELLSTAGLQTRYTREIESAVWAKGLVNAAMSPVAALANCTIGEVLDSPARAILDRLIAEGMAVAAAEKIELPSDYMGKAFELLDHARAHVPSMVEDIRRGCESEVGQLNRQIIEHARQHGIDVPTHETVDALIETFDWKVYHRPLEQSKTVL